MDLAGAIEKGVERGLVRCGVYDDDIGWMTASVAAAVMEEIKATEAQRDDDGKRNAAS